MKKKLKYKQRKCESCGSNLIYSPSLDALYCKNCGNHYDIENSKEFEKHDFDDNLTTKNEVKEWSELNKVMQCKNCGAQIILDKLEFAKECQYCGSPVVSEIDELPGIKPDAVIPFKFDGVEAVKKFNVGVRKKWFLPNDFKKNLPKSEMVGTYIPCFGFDTNTNSSYSGIFAYTVSYRDSDGHRQTREETKFVSGTHQQNFLNLLIESSAHISDMDLTDIKPYNMNEARKFNQDYLKGYTVEHYQDDVNVCFDLAKAKITSQIKSKLPSKHGCTRIVSINLHTNYDAKKYCYYLLPTYNFMYKYKDKSYNTLMNGQTGKVGSNVPRSKVKITLFVLMLVLIFLGIIALAYFFGDTPETEVSDFTNF